MEQLVLAARIQPALEQAVLVLTALFQEQAVLVRAAQAEQVALVREPGLWKRELPALAGWEVLLVQARDRPA
jgi:hypothetical protein